ncbi:hypothetical protein AB0L88_17665 [Saccharopolyspora shandongensis]|uniref:hypothetical protein n=1 Tax=Saccharopolyspora shandongensis TaxID=418495 RepID=UPI0034198256
MTAWSVSQLGEPIDVVHLVERDVPEPGGGQLVVSVLASAANFSDVPTCRGEYQVRPRSLR